MPVRVQKKSVTLAYTYKIFRINNLNLKVDPLTYYEPVRQNDENGSGETSEEENNIQEDNQENVQEQHNYENNDQNNYVYQPNNYE